MSKVEIIIDKTNDTTIINYQSLYGVVVQPITFTNTSNTTGYFRFQWDDNDNVPRNATLNVYVGDDYDLNCTTTTISESGTIYCYINTTTRKYFTATGLIDGSVIQTHPIWFGNQSATSPVRDCGVFGYAITFLIVNQSVGAAVTTRALLFLSAVILTSPLNKVEPSVPLERNDLDPDFLEAPFDPETRFERVFESSSALP